MKKLIIILGLIVFAFSANAQWKSESETYNKYLDGTYLTAYYYGGASDTIGTSDSTWTQVVLVNNKDELKYDIYIEADSTGGTASDVYFIRQTKTTEGQSYSVAAGDTTTWAMSSTDTSFTISEGTATSDRFFKIIMKGSNDELKAKLSKLQIHFYE